MASASRDTAGLETTFVYDRMGRMTDEQPEVGQGVWVKTTYVNATTEAKARVEVERQLNGGGSSLAKSQVIFDGLGRVSES